MIRTRLLRSIEGLLQPLTGDRATGTVAMKAADADLVLPKGTYLAPVLVSDTGNKQLAPGQMYRTLASATLTSSAEVDVPIESVVGGERMNLPEGTEFVPLSGAPAGIDPLITASSAVSGATTFDGIGAVKQVAIFEELQPGSAPIDAFWAKLSMFPAVVIVWESSGAGEKIGPNKSMRRDIFSAHVVISRLDAGELRSAEGLEILDALEAILTRSARIESTSRDVDSLGADRVVSTPQLYVYRYRFQTTVAVVRRDDREFEEWTSTRYTMVSTPIDPSLTPSRVTLIEGAVYDQDPSTPLPNET